MILLFMALVIPISPAHVAGQAPSTVQASLVGFNLSVTPSTFDVHNGTNANASILVTSQGLTGPVSLTTSVFPSSGIQATADPSTVTVLPGGNAASTLEINATSARLGEYEINLTGSAPLATSQSVMITVQVRGARVSHNLRLPDLLILKVHPVPTIIDRQRPHPVPIQRALRRQRVRACKQSSTLSGS